MGHYWAGSSGQIEMTWATAVLPQAAQRNCNRNITIGANFPVQIIPVDGSQNMLKPPETSAQKTGRRMKEVEREDTVVSSILRLVPSIEAELQNVAEGQMQQPVIVPAVPVLWHASARALCWPTALLRVRLHAARYHLVLLRRCSASCAAMVDDDQHRPSVPACRTGRCAAE